MVRGCTRSVGWKVVAWAMMLLFAIAPLEAQAAMSSAATGHHVHAAANSDHHASVNHDPLSQMAHVHHGDGEQAPTHHGGHDHSKPHSGSCCGTFCHTPFVELLGIGVTATPPSCLGYTPLIVYVAGIEFSDLLRPPKA